MAKTTKLVALNKLLSQYESKSVAASEIGTTIQNVNRWEQRGTFPPKWALKIEKLTKGKIKAMEILKENEAIENNLS